MKRDRDGSIEFGLWRWVGELLALVSPRIGKGRDDVRHLARLHGKASRTWKIGPFEIIFNATATDDERYKPGE